MPMRDWLVDRVPGYESPGEIIQWTFTKFKLNNQGLSLTPYVSLVVSLTSLGWTLTKVPPSSPKRLFLLLLVLISAAITAFTAPGCSTIPAWNTTIGIMFGSQLMLEAIDHIYLSRRYFQPGGEELRPESSPFSTPIEWFLDVIFNKRRIATLQQIKNVPEFNSRIPTYVPSRLQFLVSRGIRCVLAYVLVDLLTSPRVLDASDRFSAEKTALWTRLLQSQLTWIEIGDRVGSTIGFRIVTYLVHNFKYDLVACMAVAFAGNSIERWPPRFNSVGEAYSIRRFWGVFWHQDLRSPLTSNSAFIAHHVLGLPKDWLISRYVKLILAFALSGAVHLVADYVNGLPIVQSGAPTFYCMHAIGIIVEDAVIALYRRLSRPEWTEGKAQRPAKWQKAIGFAWTILFFVWSTPYWSYPIMRLNVGFPLPIRFFDFPPPVRHD